MKIIKEIKKNGKENVEWEKNQYIIERYIEDGII